MCRSLQILAILPLLFVLSQALTKTAVKQMNDLDPRAKELLLGIEKDLIANVSNECTNAIRNLTTANNTSLVGKYLDAWGKIPSAVEEGNTHWIGSYGLCKSIQSAHYCLANVALIISKKPLPICSLGICLPKACSESDITFGLKDLANELYKFEKTVIIYTNSNVKSVYCAKPSKYDASSIFCVVVCALLSLLCVVGTIIDMLQTSFPSILLSSKNKQHQNQMQNGVVHNNSMLSEENPPIALNEDDTADLLNTDAQLVQSQKTNIVIQILKCFSIVTNTKKIMDTSAVPGAITSLNGMRVLSMTWVILGHCYLWMLMTGIVENPVSAFGIIHRLSFEALNNAFLSVDSFFFLSGLLVGYIGLRRMSKNNGRLPLFQFYFHRFWRLTPSYMFVIFFYNNLDPFLNEGPLWFTHQLGNICSTKWWTNLLYINNFYPNELGKECLGWSWYLANDMQFYVISPILLYAIYRFGKVGLVASVGSLLVASLATTGALIGYYDLPVALAGELEGGAKGISKANDYSNMVYIKPYCRISPYLVGIALGYLIFVNKKHSLAENMKRDFRALFVLIGWVSAIVIGLASLYGMYKQFKIHPELFTLTENVIYGMMFRFTWALALAWVIYSCHTGLGGLVDSILSANFWIPLSRLTYGTYLVHPIVLGVFFGGFQHTVVYTDMLLSFYFISIVAVSYGIAFILAITVEFPMMQLEKLFGFK